MPTRNGAPLNASAEYCSDLVRRTNEDFWLSAQYAPGAGRDKLLALFALHAEISRIPSIVSEPPLGEIRLQWWREALDEIIAGDPARAHPVVEALREAGVIDHHVRDEFEKALEARARLFYGEGFQTVDDLQNWLTVAEAYLAPLVFRSQQKLMAPVRDAALAYNLARLGPALAPALADEARRRAVRLLGEARKKLRRLPADLAPGVLYVSLTHGYLNRDHGARWPLAKRLHLAATMATGRI